MEKGTIQDIEKNYFGPGYTSQYAGEDLSRDSPSLTTYSFAGLFTITAFLTLLALICSECSFAISSYRNRNSINPAEDVPPKNDEQDSEGVDEILKQEESHEQEVELTNANNDHGGG